MYCPQCGNILPDNASFCNKCGSSTGVEPQSDGVGSGGNRSRVVRIVVIAVIVVALIVTGVLVVPRVVTFVSSHIASSYDPDEFVDELQDASDVAFDPDADSDDIEDAAEDLVTYVLDGCSSKGLKGLIEYVDDEYEDCDDEDELIEVLTEGLSDLSWDLSYSTDYLMESALEDEYDEYSAFFEVAIEFDVGEDLSSSEIKDLEDGLEDVYDIKADVDEAVWIEATVYLEVDDSVSAYVEDSKYEVSTSEEDICICRVGRHWYVYVFDLYL